MNAALALVDYAEMRQRQAQLRQEGRYLGIGLATISESSGVGPSMAMGAVGFRRAGHESARVAVHADGRATVFCGTQSTGQGHATSLAQIAASVLGIALDDIEVVEGDTQGCRSVPGPSTRSMASAARPCARRLARSLIRPEDCRLQAAAAHT
jgi:carbon-monoxide dehydrogenase large subunit